VTINKGRNREEGILKVLNSTNKETLGKILDVKVNQSIMKRRSSIN
jgi:hypothetical protein